MKIVLTLGSLTESRTCLNAKVAIDVITVIANNTAVGMYFLKLLFFVLLVKNSSKDG